MIVLHVRNNSDATPAVTLPQHTEGPVPITLINPFSVTPAAEPGFLESWKRTAAIYAKHSGYIDANLHRALDPQARFRFVNVAHWDSAEAWSAATKAFPPSERGAAGVEANPALYTPIASEQQGIGEQHGAADAVRAQEHELARAYRTNDADALDRLLADDYTVTDGPGTVSDKAKVLADHRARRIEVRSFVFDDMAVRALGPDTAIATGQYTWDASYAGHPIPGGTFRYLRVYVRTGTGWRIQAGQVTPVRPAP